MKRYRATTSNGVCEFEVTNDKRVILVCDNGLRVDTTEFTLLASDFIDPEDALIDLYTDNGSGENVSIEEVTE